MDPMDIYKFPYIFTKFAMTFSLLFPDVHRNSLVFEDVHKLWVCFGHVVHMLYFGHGFGHVLEMSWKCFGYVSGMFLVCFYHVSV